MARNLREKIAAIVNDTYDVRKESTISALERLVKDELDLREQERELTYQDVCYIKSVASDEYTKMRMTEDKLGKMAGDHDAIRMLCMIHAFNGFLRSKGLTPIIFRYKK